ncbi:MAG: AbiV family abortive infection protein [Ferruginibacter sp.]
MAQRKFTNLSDEECLKVYPTIWNNFNRHYKIAKLLGEHQEYPNAIAHLILGTEELVKALALLLQGKGFRVSNMKKYKLLFSNHGARHVVIKDIYSFAIFFSNISRMVDRKNDKSIKNMAFVTYKIFTSIAQGIKNDEWWKEADKRKQKCFYVDFENELLSPDRFTVDDFQEALTIINVFKKDAGRLRRYIFQCSEDELKGYISRVNQSKLFDTLNERIKKSGT